MLGVSGFSNLPLSFNDLPEVLQFSCFFNHLLWPLLYIYQDRPKFALCKVFFFLFFSHYLLFSLPFSCLPDIFPRSKKIEFVPRFRSLNWPFSLVCVFDCVVWQNMDGIGDFLFFGLSILGIILYTPYIYIDHTRSYHLSQPSFQIYL